MTLGKRGHANTKRRRRPEVYSSRRTKNRMNTRSLVSNKIGKLRRANTKRGEEQALEGLRTPGFQGRVSPRRTEARGHQQAWGDNYICMDDDRHPQKFPRHWKISPAVYIPTAFSLLNTWSYQLVATNLRIAGDCLKRRPRANSS